jgi:hypothetical protein
MAQLEKVMKRPVYASLFVVTALALAPAVSHAASPAQVHELFEVMGMQKLMENMVPAVIPNITNTLINSMKQSHPDLPADMPDIINKVVTDTLTPLLPQIQATSEKIYADNLTDEEVSGAIAYYRTPAGQSFLRKAPIMTQQSMQAAQSVITGHLSEVQPRLAAEIKKRHPDFQ